MFQTRHRARLLSFALLIVAGCGRDVVPTDPSITLQPTVSLNRSEHGAEASALAAVRSGNAQIIASAASLVPPGAPLAPFIEARLYAIANVAMHDALNGVAPRYERYADDGDVDRGANAAAAVLTAANDAIV